MWDHRLRRTLIVLSCFAATPLAAEPVKLSSDAIKITIAGSRLELDTPLGMTVSVRFNRDGFMSGDAKELASLLGASKDRGRWWVASDQLCYKWFRWFDAEPRCLAIRQEAKRLFWQRDDGESGTATIMEQGKPPPKPKLKVAIAAQIPRVQVKATHPADVKANATTALNALPHTVQTREDAQVQLWSRPTNISTKTQSPPKSPITVLSVPAPQPAVRPKPHLVAATQPRSTDLNSLENSEKKSFRVAGVGPADVLNVRDGPSEDDDAVGEIPPTARGITIVGSCLDDWCPIKHRDVTGWVNRYYLSEDVPR